MLVKKNKGFTLVEILVVIAILLIMILILIGILNPIVLVNKAKDSRRKKDLNRIRVAFEEYFNDKGCYPNKTLRDQLIDSENCGTNFVFSPWLRPWPCDPNGEAYEVLIGYDENCPKWFKVLAIFENKNDSDINITGSSEDDYNYAVTSGNILPNGYLGDLDPGCNFNGSCYKKINGTCESVNNPIYCEGPNCYKRPNCELRCQVSKCP